MHRHSDHPWLLELPSCPSTNTWAMEHVADLTHGDCIWTQDQQQGRGQAGRDWHSDSGVLTASFVVELAEDLLGPTMSMCAGLAVAHCVEDLCNIERVDIKWPNDCFVAGRKLAGILCEGKRHDGKFYMIIGIGLNVAPQWEHAPSESHFNGRPPISMEKLGSKEPLVMLDVITSLRGYLLESVGLIKAKRWQVILPGLRKRDCLLGSHIQVNQEHQQVLGIGAGIDEDGSLLLRLPDGGCMSCTSSFNLRVMDMSNGLTHE